jgi:Protein of unknown function (DUF2974)
MKTRIAQILSVVVTAVIPFVLFGSAPSAGQETGEKIDAATAEQVLPYGLMSQDAYYDTARINIPGWTRVDDTWETIFEQNRQRDLINGAESVGFYAAIYRNNRTGEICIAYRGTASGSDWTDTNFPAANGSTPDQYRYAVALAVAVQKVYHAPSISVTGHSNGGSKATYAARQTAGITKVITFNAASPGLLSSATRGGTNQINVVVPGDIVSHPPDALVGLGHLPGTTYSVAPFETNLFAQTQPKILHDDPFDNHSIENILGGLCIVSPTATSCPSLQPAPGGQQPQMGVTPYKLQPVLPQAPTTTGAAPPPPPIPAAPPSWKAPSTTFTPSASLSAIPPSSHPAPGGISLSRAAAARMPLNIGPRRVRTTKTAGSCCQAVLIESLASMPHYFSQLCVPHVSQRIRISVSIQLMWRLGTPTDKAHPQPYGSASRGI